MKSALAVLAAVLVVVAFVGCTQGGEKLDGHEVPAGTAPAQAGQSSMEPQGPQPMDLAGVAFLPAENWTAKGPSGMRKATFNYGPAEGDHDEAEISVFYFGGGQGGDIEANINRWIGQMEPPEGKTIEQVMRRSKLTTATGLNIHFVEVDGTFMKSLGGGPMTGGRKKPMEGWRMVGSIIEAPEGNVFFKLVGPDKTVREMEEDYRSMLTGAVRI